jgi:hypothetical protein
MRLVARLVAPLTSTGPNGLTNNLLASARRQGTNHSAIEPATEEITFDFSLTHALNRNVVGRNTYCYLVSQKKRVRVADFICSCDFRL